MVRPLILVVLFALLLLAQDKLEISEPVEGAAIAVPALTLKEILKGRILGKLSKKASVEGVVRAGKVQRAPAAHRGGWLGVKAKTQAPGRLFRKRYLSAPGGRVFRRWSS